MITSVRIIVLNHTKIGENAVVLHTVSPQFGRRSFITRVSKAASMTLFLPMNILDAEVVENSKSDLWRIRNMKAVYSFSGIRSNMYKNTMTLFMSEVLYRTIHDGSSEEGLFEWCERSLLTLDAMTSDFSNYHIRFLLGLSIALGFSPSAEDLAPFAGEHLQTLAHFLKADFGESMLIPLSGAVRNEIAESLLKYISHHTESNIEVRSLKVLREIYV